MVWGDSWRSCRAVVVVRLFVGVGVRTTVRGEPAGCTNTRWAAIMTHLACRWLACLQRDNDCGPCMIGVGLLPTGPSYPFLVTANSKLLKEMLSCTTKNTVIGCALSEVVHLEPLLDHISTVVQDLNHC
jgi:hypothetical protein